MEVTPHFENLKTVIKSELKLAEKSVIIAVAWINFKEYQDVIEFLLERNVKLKIIISDTKSNRGQYNIINALQDLGAEIKLMRMPNHKNLMHNKFVVIDEETIINGSFNWSINATESIENILVIKGFPNAVTDFIDEFEKLEKLEETDIFDLQGVMRCKESGCDGELFNVLIFSEKSKYNSVYGDIVEVCACCENQKTVERGIPNHKFESILMAYQNCESEKEWLEVNRHMNSSMNSYVTNPKITIDAIGRVNSGLTFDDEDFVETNIIWKNKFIGDRLQDKFYDNSFGVVYDN